MRSNLKTLQLNWLFAPYCANLRQAIVCTVEMFRGFLTLFILAARKRSLFMGVSGMGMIAPAERGFQKATAFIGAIKLPAIAIAMQSKKPL